MIQNKLRILLGAALIAAAAAACGRSPVQTEVPAAGAGPASWDTEPTDTINIDTGYFGSGHYQPPADSLDGVPPG